MRRKGVLLIVQGEIMYFMLHYSYFIVILKPCLDTSPPYNIPNSPRTSQPSHDTPSPTILFCCEIESSRFYPG